VASRNVRPGALDLSIHVPRSDGRTKVELRWRNVRLVSPRDSRPAAAHTDHDPPARTGLAAKALKLPVPLTPGLLTRASTAEFDAYGDEGSIKEAVFVPPIRAELPFGLAEEIDSMWVQCRTTGWGLDTSPDAGFDGILTIDVATGKVVEEFDEFRAEEME